MFYLYILQSDLTGGFYIGQTQDIDKRLARHNANQCRSTRQKGPWRVVYIQSFSTRSKAMAAESHIKRMKSREYIEGLIAGNSEADG